MNAKTQSVELTTERLRERERDRERERVRESGRVSERGREEQRAGLQQCSRVSRGGGAGIEARRQRLTDRLTKHQRGCWDCGTFSFLFQRHHLIGI